MKFEGSYVALVTPFDREGRLDEETYRDLIRRQIKGGTQGLVPCGSTGEAATLIHEEFRRAIEIACDESRGEIPVIAGVGTNATWKAVESAREAESLGADALLVLAPYYNKPTQEGIYQHFRAVARESRLPIVAYNIPGRTGVNILPKTLARLAKDFPSIVAVKEAAGSLDQISEILALTPPHFTVLSGDDSLTLPMMSVGAKGVVSVVANVAPKETQALCAAFLKGDVKKARALHHKLFPLIKSLFIETNPIPVKAALAMMGACRPEPRLPLTPLSTENRRALKKALKEFGLI
ncbi:MAG: 4-hydroxy-tetrahydrodipicolinate synthase [Elusimicrobia bacterium CG11_big_fil_rev_8_21_14_0_20_64_6]|nr:MAG: 4-hydroxy-tetrahydrodipicolinate synthase [Elusimicrobia bacterium CG11_big_fil_rev_8_21_14_0_20_64_6]